MADNREYIRNSDEKGSINISEDVIAVIAAAATTEVEGVYGLFYAHGKELSNMMSKKSLSRGIKLLIEENNVDVDVFIMVEMGYSVSDIGEEVQKSVASAIESAVGVTVNTVNVHICGISLRKSKQTV